MRKEDESCPCLRWLFEKTRPTRRCVPVARLYNIGDDIVKRAREAGASVIVVGTHGRTGLGRLFLGSVSERVVRHAHCDVYVARPPRS